MYKLILHFIFKNYTAFFEAVTGKKVTLDDIILMSERVYNFQRIFNKRMGFGTRENDSLPYRAMGPVTIEEYESRGNKYDRQLKEEIGIDPVGKSTNEKIIILRSHREAEYEKLKKAVYDRRGWDSLGVPTKEKLKALGILFHDVATFLNSN